MAETFAEMVVEIVVNERQFRNSMRNAEAEVRTSAAKMTSDMQTFTTAGEESAKALKLMEEATSSYGVATVGTASAITTMATQTGALKNQLKALSGVLATKLGVLGLIVGAIAAASSAWNQYRDAIDKAEEAERQKGVSEAKLLRQLRAQRGALEERLELTRRTKREQAELHAVSDNPEQIALVQSKHATAAAKREIAALHKAMRAYQSAAFRHEDPASIAKTMKEFSSAKDAINNELHERLRREQRERIAAVKREASARRAEEKSLHEDRMRQQKVEAAARRAEMFRLGMETRSQFKSRMQSSLQSHIGAMKRKQQEVAFVRRISAVNPILGNLMAQSLGLSKKDFGVKDDKSKSAASSVRLIGASELGLGSGSQGLLPGQRFSFQEQDAQKQMVNQQKKTNQILTRIATNTGGGIGP